MAVLAALVALACAAACTYRMWLAANPTALHPDEVLAALDRGVTLERIREAAAKLPDADWERDLIDAVREPRADARAALVNEQLTEVDRRIQRWERVPRVSASLASSAALMLATLVLRRGLAASPDLSAEVAELVVRGLIAEALAVAAMGMVGTAFAIAAQGQAKRIVRARAAATDRLVERLERLAAPGPSST
jgi:hypothetical protein